MKKVKNRRWFLWLAVPTAIAGFLGLLSLPFVIDEPPPNDAHLRPVRSEVPRERNGFFALNLTREEAEALVEKGAGEEEASEEELEKERECAPFTEGWNLDLAERILKRKGRLLERFDESLRFPEFQVPEIDQVEMPVPYLMELRDVSQLALIRAAVLFDRGNEPGAFHEAFKVVQFGLRLQGAGGPSIHFLVGRSIKAGGTACITRFIEKTKLDAREVQSVVDSLPAFDDGMWKAALRREYVIMANAAERFSRGENLGLDWPPFIPRRPFFKPQQTKRLLAEVFQALIGSPKPMLVAEKRKLWASALEKVRGPRWVPTNFLGKVVAELMVQPHERSFLDLATEDFSLFAPKLLFALKRFQRDRGALPDSLDELVPSYLKEIPRDPFDGEKLRYDKARKIVWTVGPDLSFNGNPESEETGIVGGPALRIGF